MKLEHKDKPLLFSETIIPDIFFTDYLPELSGDCLKLYLYMSFLSKYNKSVKVNDLSKKLSLPLKDINSYVEVLEKKGLILKKTSGYIVLNLQEITLHKLYSPNLTASEDKIKANAENAARAKAIDHINNRYFQGVMSPAWYTDINDWFDLYHFDEQVMIALFEHCFSRSKFSKSYIQKVAESWGNSKVRSWSDLEIYSQNQDKFNKIVNSIAKKLGRFNGLTEFEIEYIKNWVFVYGYDMNVIEIALKRTTFKQAPNFEYLNRLISDWHDRGFKEPEEVLMFIERRKKQDKCAKELNKKVSKLNYAQRSYDNLDFLYANRETGNSGA